MIWAFPPSTALCTQRQDHRERRLTVQRFVAAIAESVRLVEDNPEKAKAAVAKALKVNNKGACNWRTKPYESGRIIRRSSEPPKAVARRWRAARGNGSKVTKKAPDLIDGSFVENLDKTGFLKELWGGNVP